MVVRNEYGSTVRKSMLNPFSEKGNERKKEDNIEKSTLKSSYFYAISLLHIIAPLW